jgi:hypothetical protein
MVDIPVRRDHGARIDAGVSEIDAADETRLVFRYQRYDAAFVSSGIRARTAAQERECGPSEGWEEKAR